MARILLIDDDEAVRSPTARGEAGLEIWREQGADLVITDLCMPDISGLELIVQLRAFAPPGSRHVGWSGEPAGLGLTFCKMAVEAHLGTIRVNSVVGKGSTFWFRLPQGPPGNGRQTLH